MACATQCDTVCVAVQVFHGIGRYEPRRLLRTLTRRLHRVDPGRKAHLRKLNDTGRQLIFLHRE